MSQSLSRRHFLSLSATTIGGIALSTSMTGCAISSSSTDTLSDIDFSHGVASGDPLKDAVILWTRALPKDNRSNASLAWELSTDKSFTNIIRSGVVLASESRDYTVKVDVQELSPATEYFYRFKGRTQTSTVGRTKTLPVNDPQQIKFVVVSCSNYPAGYFNAYQEAAKTPDLDAVLHLGDYIYEYDAKGYATERAAEIGREFADDNLGELLTLKDYRNRYAIYRTDEGLAALHAAAPFIAVWDDHEVMNDTWSAGGENHNLGEGDFFERRAAAIQAYYEWLPIRPPKGELQPHIYRTFDFGKLLSLHMLDTRVIGRDQQLNYADYMDKQTKQMDTSRFIADLYDDNRSLLGKEQFSWLANSLKDSQAKWQLLGQQVLMGKMHIPAVMLGNLGKQDSAALTKKLTIIKSRLLAGEALTPQEQSLINTVLPYNLDAWDGYPAEREKLYAEAAKLGKKLVVVAGDTHNAWTSQLTDKAGGIVGVEFATPAVTSPGVETYLKLDEQGAMQTAQALTLLIDDLQYCDLRQRGYLALEISESGINANWTFIDNILSTEYQVTNTHTVNYSV
ncbi:alkaline phosphatase D family protein [Paraglaciecola sp. 2405UD69-4]|uniref:alkaline phosphatase D family protein n=1 Tax=Paraglaciecola sp. 2405UD69-4 TaxID=3391836 RepID=UPI0039C97F19